MSQDETDPGASTDRFRAFVEGGDGGADRPESTRRPSPAVGAVWAVSLLLLAALAAGAWLLVQG